VREDVREDVKMSRCERRCQDEKMFYRPPLLEEPCAQTLSGTKANGRMHASSSPTTANLPKRELLKDKSAIVSRHLPFAIVLPELEFPSSKCPKILDLGSAGPKPGIHICEGSVATFKAIGEETKNWSTSSFT